MGEKVEGVKDMVNARRDSVWEKVAKERDKFSEIRGKGRTIKQKMEKILGGSVTELASVWKIWVKLGNTRLEGEYAKEYLHKYSST